GAGGGTRRDDGQGGVGAGRECRGVRVSGGRLVSTVTGILRAGLGPVDLLRACFPGGSVTGCPKIRAMQVIEELEPVRRGPYCGAIFAMGHDGFMESSITIRTIVLHGERLWLQAGGAIVADSEPAAEHDETMAKAASALAAIAGVSG
ncbi:MAG: hypothetical protein DYG91_10210, partial [Chloroflexi bacterium CFX7]|nr:hypothetical protein [Chloroflexi bacterium CFX7]